MQNIFKTNYRKPANTTEAVVQKITTLLKTLAALAVAAYMVHILTAGQDNIINGGTPDGDARVMDIREPVKDSPSYVLEQHAKTCWTMDQEPKAELPGAAIVQFPGGHTEYVNNKTPKGFKIVDAAFNEALAAVGFGDKTTDRFDVIALCK